MALIFFLFMYSLLAIVASLLFIIGKLFNKKFFTNSGLVVLLLPVFLVTLSYIINILFVEKMNLNKNEIYGEYVIDTDKFEGRNTDWQYDHFKIDITRDNKLKLYIYNNNGDVAKIITRKIEIMEGYTNARLNINPNSSDYHILQENPTLYRNVWSFYYVFHSSKYGNMFFVKKAWYQF